MADLPYLHSFNISNGENDSVASCSLSFQGRTNTSSMQWAIKKEESEEWGETSSKVTTATVTFSFDMERGKTYVVKFRGYKSPSYTPWRYLRFYVLPITSLPEVTTESRFGAAVYKLQRAEEYSIFARQVDAELEDGNLICRHFQKGIGITARLYSKFPFDNKIIQSRAGADLQVPTVVIADGPASSLATPTGVTQSLSGNSVVITWGAVANANLYEVKARPTNQAAFSFSKFTTATTATFDFAELLPNVLYLFTVSAIDTTDNYARSSFTSSVSRITPDSPVLPYPTGLYTDQITGNSARTNWQAVENASNYKVQYKAAGDTVWTETFTD